MKQFKRSAILYILVLILVLEVFSRLIIDPVYFWRIDTYKEDKDSGMSFSNLRNYRSDHVDFLFIGSSRVNAAVDEEVVRDSAENANVINAARGYTTGGTHYAALQDCIRKKPDFLKGAKVFIELPGVVYTENFDTNRFTLFEMEEANGGINSMVHLILPYFNADQFFEFFRHSDNSPSVKADFAGKYLFSLYRAIPFVKEIRKDVARKVFSAAQPETNLTSAGGIKVDEESVEKAKMQAIHDVNLMIADQKPISMSSLNVSIISEMAKLIRQNGGELFFFEMPMHSELKRFNETAIGKENVVVFREWATRNGISILSISDFEYTDADFPDFWHLSNSRASEFTSKLYYSFKNHSERDLF